MVKPDISVILPVYNVEQCLRKCLDSVIKQIFQDIEIICINDGSTDTSPAILEEYMDFDRRIRVIHQPNLSLGAARNHGMEVAVGEYLIFWDSDDYFESDALSALYDLAKEQKADLCICDAFAFDDASGCELNIKYLRPPYPKPGPFQMKDCDGRIFQITTTNCWNRLVRRNFMIENQILFPVGNITEDISAGMLQLALAQRISICEKKLIHYRANRKGSLMSTYGDYPERTIAGCEETYQQFLRRGLLNDDRVFRSFMDKIITLYFLTLKRFKDFDQFSCYYEKMFHSERSLLNNWDDNWEETLYSIKYMEARNSTPEEFLFGQFRHKTADAN